MIGRVPSRLSAAQSLLTRLSHFSSSSPRVAGRYVLAAVGNPACDPNAATAYGVLGSLEATFGGSVKDKKLLVHGCGNVGAIVAKQLTILGAKEVLTVDVNVERSALPGCTQLPSDSDWWATECDALVPCSASGLLTTERAAQLRCTAIVGATNLPFASIEAKEVAENDRGVIFVPEGVSSAGAVVVDSVRFPLGAGSGGEWAGASTSHHVPGYGKGKGGARAQVHPCDIIPLPVGAFH